MNKKTLCKNNDIYTNLDQLRSSRDPFFEKTAASFDAGGMNGLMVKNLTTQKSGSLVFNGDDKLHCLASTVNFQTTKNFKIFSTGLLP